MSGVQAIQTKNEFLTEFKIWSSENIPQVNAASISIFKEKGVEALEAASSLKGRMEKLEKIAEKAEYVNFSYASFQFMKAALTATVLAVAIFGIVTISWPAAIPMALLYTAYGLINAGEYSEQQGLNWDCIDYFVVVASGIAAALPILQMIKDCMLVDTEHYSQEKEKVKQELQTLGKTVSEKGPELAKKIKAEIKLMDKKVFHDSVLKEQVELRKEQYKQALVDLENATNYYKEFSEG